MLTFFVVLLRVEGLVERDEKRHVMINKIRVKMMPHYKKERSTEIFFPFRLIVLCVY